MRKVAANRIVRLPENDVQTLRVIEIADSGECEARSNPLDGEVCGTEWLAGIIILAPFEVRRKGEEAFSEMVARLAKGRGKASDGGYRAYWVHPFDCVRMTFFPSTTIAMLK